MANPGQRVDALPSFHFEVYIGSETYPFKSVGGLSSETKVFEIEEGGQNGFVHKLPGQTTFPPLQLRQGFCNPSSGLYKLYKDFISGGKPTRFNGYVRQLGPNGTSAKWEFQNGWICKWQGPELDAGKNEVSIESIEIVHEGLNMVAGGGADPSAAKKGFFNVGGTAATLFSSDKKSGT
jgi:phage tail-like protein